jgi:prolyl oligopeptidase
VEIAAGIYASQAAPEADKNPLLKAFRQMPHSIEENQRKRLADRASRAYEQHYRPAWRKLSSYLKSTYAPATRTSLGLSENFNGAELYQVLIRQQTTTKLTAREIHDIGLKEMDRITKEMAAIRASTGFKGTAEEFEARVLSAPEMLFRSEAEILAHGRDIAKRIDPLLPKLFRKLPRMPYGVEAIPGAIARTAAPHYRPPALDGSRAGYFYLRTVDPEKQSRCCMESLILHEAVPGHHLQIALAREMQNVPDFRKMGGYTAYSEGWGLYAESLGEELGMYRSPYERYGRLQTEVMRAARLVVDTGVHALGWTREQMIATMAPSKGGWLNDDFIAAEVDRYIARPAQALAYKIGGLRIAALRRKAEQALGSKFDIREFHDVVLRNGGLPLDILEEEVDSWIASKRG